MTKVALILVLSLSDATRGARTTLLRTLENHTENSRTYIITKEREALSNDELESLRAEGLLVYLDWKKGEVAHIQISRVSQPWVAQSVEFSNRDPMTERARTLAFSLLSMLPEWKHASLAKDKARPSSVGGKSEPIRPPGWLALGMAGRTNGLWGGQLEGALCFFTFFCGGAQGGYLNGFQQESTATIREWNTLAFVEGRWFSPRAPVGAFLRSSFGLQSLSADIESQQATRYSAMGGLEAGAVWQPRPYYAALSIGSHYAGPVRVFVNDAQVSEINPLFVQVRLTLGVSWRALPDSGRVLVQAP